MSETFRQDLHELKVALLTAAAARNQRDHFDTATGELGWVIHERHVMLDATNRLRASRGLLPIDEDAIIRIETSASGHIDYVQKFAIGCAELAGERPHRPSPSGCPATQHSAPQIPGGPPGTPGGARLDDSAKRNRMSTLHELVANTGIVPTEHGFRIRTAETHFVDVHRALFNWRLVLHVHGAECSPSSVEHPHGVCPTLEHGFCYFGLGLESLARAVAAGLEWQDPLHTDPPGFDRKAF